MAFMMGWASGKQVAYPKCLDEQGNMAFFSVDGPERLVKASFGIPEPDDSCPLWEDEGNALCILPALSVDKYGYRLGYGKGYYDRFFGQFEGTGIGVTYSELILSDLPYNRFDLKADLIVSEKGVSVTREA